MTQGERRFRRQFAMLERYFPSAKAPLEALRSKRWRLVRIPLALFLVLGGIVSFLPILGVWMLPLGLVLLALDIPVLRGPISVFLIRGRRLIQRWHRRWRDWRQGGA